MTSAEEVGFHRTQEFGFIGVFRDEARYVELLADFIGALPDLHDTPEHLVLSADPDIGYPEGQSLAAALRREGHRGLLYPSVQHKGGRCFAAFDPSIIQNVRPGASWKLTWNGTPEFSFEGI